MESKYEQFDRSKLNVLSLDDRKNLVSIDDLLAIGDLPMPIDNADIDAVAAAIEAANERNASVVLMIGAHTIKQGLSRYLIDFIRRGLISVIACNGACAIHDYELARIGATSESVAENITAGKFGMWEQTAELNDIVTAGNAEGLGFGESVGRAISQSQLPHKDISVFAAAWEAGVPATVHIGIGHDIIHQHPNFNPAAAGEASYRDFLIYTRVIENLEGGVVLCFGTAVMGPEVYLKALSMARNVASSEGQEIRNFTSAVFDLVGLSGDLNTEAPKDTPEYYYRPFKTILVRTVRDGGKSFYIRGDHLATIPALHHALT
ncbi:MAG: hypothetical protein HN350_10385 [Phycisphaerales bacterium]|jgi:hypothetical protein|nr:hypothetical protein [Phycisphaerales bacterium]